MDELVNLVSEKAGITEQQALKAVETVVSFLKDKLPAPLDGQVESVLGSSSSTGSVGDITKGIGGLFGKK